MRVDLNGLKGARKSMYLTPGDQAREDIEWLGTIERYGGDSGALGRLTTTGNLVQVNAGSTRTIEQREAELALSIARGDAERLRLMIDKGGYTQRSAARAIEISDRSMRYYCSGTYAVPRVVMLAMEHLVTCPTRE